MADCAQAMGDHERGAAAQQLFEALLDQAFAFAVQVAGGFVEDEDPGVGQDGSRDRKPLPLAAAQAHSALTDHGVVPVAQAFDEFGGVGCPGCLLDASARRPAVAVGDVLGDRAVEEKDVLLDDSQEATVALDLNLTEIHAVERDRAGGWVVESGDQVAERRLARSAPADQGDGFARLDFEVDVAEDLAGRSRIDETDIPEGDPARDRGLGDGASAGAVGHFARLGQQVEHAVEAREIVLELSDAGGQHGHGLQEHRQVDQEHHEVSEREPAVDHLQAAVEQQTDRGHGQEKLPEQLDRAGKATRRGARASP